MRSGIVKVPSELALNSNLKPLSGALILTFALGTAAPTGSRICPDSEPVVFCAVALAASSVNANSATRNKVLTRIDPPQLGEAAHKGFLEQKRRKGRNPTTGEPLITQ